MKDCSLWLAGEAMAELCREFGISRKTGYKIFDRYQECGMQGLTAADPASRFLLTWEALSSTPEQYAFTVFERLFKERGLPANIRSDNGVPFASAHALFNLSKLAVWWLRLGIGIERIKPGHPQQNGRHERMHLTLKKEATKPAAGNSLRPKSVTYVAGTLCNPCVRVGPKIVGGPGRIRTYDQRIMSAIEAVSSKSLADHRFDHKSIIRPYLASFSRVVEAASE